MSQQVQLRCHDTHTGTRTKVTAAPPLVLGRDLDADVTLEDPDISRRHARIFEQDGHLMLEDLGSSNGTLLNQKPCEQPTQLRPGDVVTLGGYELQVGWASAETRHRPVKAAPAPHAHKGIETALSSIEVARPPEPASTPKASPGHQNIETMVELASPAEAAAAPQADASADKKRKYAALSTLYFRDKDDDLDAAPPPPSDLPGWMAAAIVKQSDIESSGMTIHETPYLAIGGGMGSFIWVNHLMIHGVPKGMIKVVGLERKPYARYKRLCKHSQIPVHERLRSNSDSCPDNLWGWPSYGLREVGHSLATGNLGQAIKIGWQLWSEPTLAQTYTPKAGDVFLSIDKERERIGWRDMWVEGRVKAIRKTDDGRYVVLYSQKGARDKPIHKLYLAQYIQLALGYPGVRFLEDLRAFRQATGNKTRAVNAYESHEHIYRELEENGGTVLLRGRGIVASRILQKLSEVRKENPDIRVLHLMRKPKAKGQRAGLAAREVRHHWEYQPFNWPKACWGGDLREKLEQADDAERKQLIESWGGTTTADRQDWREIIEAGLQEGWYQIRFGQVERVELTPQEQVRTQVKGNQLDENTSLLADYVIDCTGLEAALETYPLLFDLVTRYNLGRNAMGRLQVSNAFEVTGMEQERGALFACGAMTLGGPYAAVDSFLGLQYAAIASLPALRKQKAPKLRRLGPLRSMTQWLRWCFNKAP